VTRLRYPAWFALAIVALTACAMFAFGRISQSALADAARQSAVPSARRAPAPPFVRATPDALASFAEEDSVWRAGHARPLSLAELRVRGDGTRSPRQRMQDRVFAHMQRGERSRAVGELRQWMATHPRDEAALLSLARLLNETGRTDEAVQRYRQLLSLQERGRQ
jgi:tetratricopeptide (TPR) repeat protein